MSDSRSDLKEERTAEVIVEKSLPRERLDAYLRTQFPVASRGMLQRLILEGHVLVDGRPVKPTHHPRAGERVQVCWPEPKSDRAEPEDIPLNILYEDEDVVVLNKSPEIVVHPASGSEKHTLVNALLHHCRGRLSGIGGVARPGIVHRLDKETSGCMVVAKNDPAHISLSEQFKARTIRKVYHALLCGRIEPPKGEIRAAIARHPSHRKVMAVSAAEGREAHTGYETIRQAGPGSLVRAFLYTGRTHQIRVHFKHIGFPLAGDLVYGKKQNQRLKEMSGFQAPRQMLHARSLEFSHPATGKRMRFRADWPQDFSCSVEQISGL